jgi:hypothetical protein
MYLERSSLSLRLQALEHLIDADTPVTELIDMLSNREQPLPMRLRLIKRYAGEPTIVTPLLKILQDEDDDLQLRSLAADTLGGHKNAHVIPALITVGADPHAPLALRLRCITALHTLGGTEAYIAISKMTDAADQLPVIRMWATLALHNVTVPAPNART